MIELVDDKPRNRRTLSYTLTELTELGSQWSKKVAGQFATKEELELTLSLFVEWLAKREREKEGER